MVHWYESKAVRGLGRLDGNGYVTAYRDCKYAGQQSMDVLDEKEVVTAPNVMPSKWAGLGRQTIDGRYD